MTAALVREQFPALMADPGIVYLDSAATAQKPQRVIDAVTAELAASTANPGRGAYPWSTRAARRLAEVRARTARFIGADSPDEIVFVSGSTAGLNAVAMSWGLANLADGDEILFSPLDHASNVYPWVNLRQVLARFGRRITLVPYRVTATGEADTYDILAKVSPRTRLIAAAHVHNVFGSMTTLEELGGKIDSSIRLCFDCSQSVGHVPVDVTRLDSDFAAFSGHKMFGVPGTGVLYVRRRVHSELAPFLPGGGTGIRLPGNGLGLSMPEGMEGGTPNLAGIAALGAAMDFIDDLGIERIAAHGQALTRFLVDRLRGLPHLRLLPGVAWADCPAGYGIVSFCIDGIRSGDLGFALSSKGFYVRTGSHCLPSGNGLRRLGPGERARVQLRAGTGPVRRLPLARHGGNPLAMQPAPAQSPVEGYDRVAASRALAGLAFPGLFSSRGGAVDAAFLGGPRRISYGATPLAPAPDSHLTSAQQGYLTSYMRPCPAGLVTSATHRVTWNDSEGIPNIAHAGPSSLGAVVPIVARETTLALWRDLAANDALAAAVARLGGDARRALAATTTDQEPIEIFRIGIEATARALIQHAYLADQTPYRSPSQFARGMRDCGIFGVVASTWYWELQASTFRRGMIPVSFVAGPGGTVRYPPEVVTMLRAMKTATIAQARAVMARATGEEGLTVPQAVQKYHHKLDLIAKQYALLGDTEQPRCLGQMVHTINGQRFSVQPGAVETYVETFVRLLDLVAITRIPGSPDEQITDPRERTFHVPDMNCTHCRATITGLLESLDICVAEMDLVTKRIVAGFRTVAARERAFDAIRDAGYTVVPPASS